MTTATLAANAPEIAGNAEADMVPALMNDPAGPAPVIATPEPVIAAPAEEAAEPVAPTSNSDRDEIAARFRAKRAAAAEKYADKGETPPFVAAAEREAHETPEPESAPLLEEAAPAPLTQPETFHVKVRGQTYAATRDQLVQMAGLTPEEAEGLPPTTLVRAAQTMEASRSYLDEAKSQFQGARSAANAPTATPAANSQQPNPVQAPAPVGNHTELLRQAAEKLQYGDPDEATAALNQALEAKLAERDTRARSELLQRDSDRAIADFGAQNRDIAEHPLASDLLVSQSVREICNDFLALGAPADQIAPLLTNPTEAYRAYNQARLANLAVRPPQDVLSAAAKTVRSIFPSQQPNAIPAALSQPQTPVMDRTAMKRALPQQPTRSVAAPAQAAATPAPSRSAAVAKMRAARGQSA